MALSKSKRFQVFKRDRFTCQYCGQTPPAVVLEVDHVHPVSGGGSDDIANLVAACFDCNRGKAARPLDSIPPTLAEQQARMVEVAAQVKAYNRLLKKERTRVSSEIERAGRYWYGYFQAVGEDYVFGPARASSVRRFLQSLPEQEVLGAIDIAMGWRLPGYIDHDEKTWKYFCGICWSKIREREGR